MAKLLQGSTAKKASGNGGSKYWTCSECRNDRCFLSRKDCHNCGVPRKGHSDAAAKTAKEEGAKTEKAKAGKENPKAEPEAMDLTEPDVPEKSLEDQIAEVESLVKTKKAVKDSEKGKAVL